MDYTKECQQLELEALKKKNRLLDLEIEKEEIDVEERRLNLEHEKKPQENK